LYKDASIKIGQLRDHIVVEGEARSPAQIAQILQTISAYLHTAQTQSRGGQRAQSLPMLGGPGAPGPGGSGPNTATGEANAEDQPVALVSPELGVPLQITGEPTTPGIINLLRVPTSQQVLLKVRVAELNRTALRNIGANFLAIDRDSGAIIGSQIAGPVSAAGQVPLGRRNLLGSAIQPVPPLGTQGGSTVFGIFQGSNFMFTLNALRRNGVLKILAEPNLVAMSGYQANFLAGGEFPVPVPQASGTGVAPTVTIRFKEFGVRLQFVPYVIDEDTIRLTVVPEVSQIDFSIAVTLIAGGSPVPGLNVRRALTTVELQQDQTLAIAGLMQLQLSGNTDRIPGLGDLPVLGPFFSNTTGQRIEKELVVLVTPYLVEGMNREQVPPTPGDEVKEPNDLEFYLLNRIEGKTGHDFRSTTQWDDVYNLRHLMKLERQYVNGPVGFSD
jgi:pilus assembly protein CpaC